MHNIFAFVYVSVVVTFCSSVCIESLQLTLHRGALPQEKCCESYATLPFGFCTYKSTIDHKTQPVITITNI